MGRIIYFFDKCKCFLSFVRVVFAEVREMGEGIATVAAPVPAAVAAPPATVVLWDESAERAAMDCFVAVLLAMTK